MTQLSIQIENTPNPATLKFVASRPISDSNAEFTAANETERSPLAAKLFGFPWTSGVFIGSNFVAVTKQEWVDWDVLAEPLAGLIREHLHNDEPVLLAETEITNDEDVNDSPLIKGIKQALNREIRPVVALDGGDVVFAKLDDNILYLQMKGACAGCPSSSATLKQGIEVRIRELFPEITEVRAL